MAHFEDEIQPNIFKINNSLLFDGSNEEFSIPNADLVSTLQGSVIATMNYVFKPDIGQNHFLLQGNGGADRGIFVYWFPNQLSIKYTLTGGVSIEAAIYTDDYLVFSEWNFLSVTLNCVTGTSTMYLNGRAIPQTSSTISPGDDVKANPTDFSFMGGGVAGFDNFKGLVNQFSIISRQITLAEHIEWYNEKKPLNSNEYFETDCEYFFNSDNALFVGSEFAVLDSVNGITASSLNMEATDEMLRTTPYINDGCGHNLVFSGQVDQSSEVQALIDNSNNGDTIEICGRELLINTPITIDKSITILHKGVKFITTGNSNIYNFAADGISIYGNATFVGTGNPGHTNQAGIDIGDNGDFKINGCFSKDLYAGIKMGNGLVGPIFIPSRISECDFQRCEYGYFGGLRSEYVCIQSCTFNENTVGLEVSGGNNIIDGCIIHRGENGIRVVNGGANPAHGIISNCEINHQSNNALFFDNFTTGHTVSNNHIYQGNIHVKDCEGVNISGGIIDVNNIRFENAVGCRFHGVTKSNAYTNIVDKSFGGAPLSTIIEYRNYETDGTVYVL